MLRLTGSGNFTETVPVLDDRGHMTPTEVERELQVDVALQWGSGYDAVLRSFVNVIATPHGGTHVAGFERALVRTLNEQLRAARLLKNGDEPVTKEDALEGLVAVISVRLPEPQFEGQTKEVLGTPAASRIVTQVVGTQLKAYLETPPRGAKQQARSILEKVVSAAKARIAAREHRDNQRRKSALASSSLPAKLVDCRSADDRSELFIVEGDSALGTAKMARDSEFQALLPIRGKILNVQKASLADMLKNAECASIIQVIGAGSGSSFDLDSARYQRVIFMADADVDGAHIRTLLLTLFHRYLRPMLDAGRVFAAVPPLHRIELTSARKGQDKYRYTLLRRRAEPDAAGPGAARPAVEGAGAAVQGAGRDGRVPAGRDDHGSPAPHPAPDQDRGRRRGRGDIRPADGDRGGPAPRLHRRRRGRAGSLPHRRLRELDAPVVTEAITDTGQLYVTITTRGLRAKLIARFLRAQAWWRLDTAGVSAARVARSVVSLLDTAMYLQDVPDDHPDILALEAGGCFLGDVFYPGPEGAVIVREWQLADKTPAGPADLLAALAQAVGPLKPIIGPERRPGPATAAIDVPQPPGAAPAEVPRPPGAAAVHVPSSPVPPRSRFPGTAVPSRSRFPGSPVPPRAAVPSR